MLLNLSGVKYHLVRGRDHPYLTCAGLELEEEECVCRLECPGHGEEEEDGSDEWVCNMRCEGVASHDVDRRRSEEYALGIKYCPGIEPILPRYTFVEYKPRPSMRKLTIFEYTQSTEVEASTRTI